MLTKVIDPNTKEVYEFYLDKRLKKDLETVVIPKLTKKDEDYILCIDGKERCGKSTFAMQIARFIDPSFSLDRVCFTPDEFRKAIINAKPFTAVLFDEAYRGLGSTSALSEVNRILKSMMMEMGQKNLFVIVILPTFYLLEKYIALWRARCLIHVFTSRGKKGYWRLFNTRKKQMLYLNPIGKRFYSYNHVKTAYKGRFYNKYAVDEQKYRKKKANAFKQGFKHGSTRNERYLQQRDKLLWILYKKCDESPQEVEELLKLHSMQLKKRQISNVIAKERQRVGK